MVFIKWTDGVGAGASCYRRRRGEPRWGDGAAGPRRLCNSTAVADAAVRRADVSLLATYLLPTDVGSAATGGNWRGD